MTKCPNCGKEIENKVEECPYCNCSMKSHPEPEQSPLQDPESDFPLLQDKKKPDSKRRLFFCIGALAVILCIVTVLYNSGNSDHNILSDKYYSGVLADNLVCCFHFKDKNSIEYVESQHGDYTASATYTLIGNNLKIHFSNGSTIPAVISDDEETITVGSADDSGQFTLTKTTQNGFIGVMSMSGTSIDQKVDPVECPGNNILSECYYSGTLKTDNGNYVFYFKDDNTVYAISDKWDAGMAAQGTYYLASYDIAVMDLGTEDSILYIYINPDHNNIIFRDQSLFKKTNRDEYLAYIPDDNNDTETVTESETMSETEASPETETLTETEPETETLTEAPQAEVTALFTDIYLPYAKREKPFIFDGVKTFAQNTTDYSTEINEPASGICSIKFTAENGDYVYFSFSPTTNDVYAITTLNYYQAATDSEVLFHNYSPDCNGAFQTHVIGESNKNVDGPDEQQSFLFN